LGRSGRFDKNRQFFSELGLQTLMGWRSRPGAGAHRAEATVPYPLRTLFWECTLQCNQLCRHCGSSATATATEDIPGDDFIEVLARLKQALLSCGQRLPFLAVTGGEPLVRPDLLPVMAAASELGYRWGLTSNGLLLDEARIEDLRLAGMRTASISLDGYGKTHDELRNSPGSFQRVVRNISALAAAGFADEVQVTTVVNPLNIGDLEPLMELLGSMPGLGSWRLASCDPIGRATADDALRLDASQLRQMLDFIVSHNSAKLPIRYACPSHLGEYELKVRPHPFYCSAGRNTMSILHNGDLAACPNIPHNSATVQGNIYDNDVGLDILSVWERRYAFHRDPMARHSGFCEGCSVWSECLGGSLHTFDFEQSVQRKCIGRELDYAK
jgi:radical SAM protein with 4Fe4S-binding SPASM domain